MPLHSIKTITRIKHPIDEVFAFFSDAYNLNKLTPDTLQFKILTPEPIEMKVGTLIDYRLKLEGLPFTWRTRISAWEPGKRFVDEQVKGPYSVWIHEHTFEADGKETIMQDYVQFKSPGWILEPIINKFIVEKRVKEIFAYREQKLKELFP